MLLPLRPFAQTVAIPPGAPWSTALKDAISAAQALDETPGSPRRVSAQVKFVELDRPPLDDGTILFGWSELTLLEPEVASRLAPLTGWFDEASTSDPEDAETQVARDYVLVLLEAWAFWCPRAVAPAAWKYEGRRGPAFGTVWEWTLFANPPVFLLGLPEPEGAPLFWHGVRAASIAENARAQNESAAWLWLRALDRASLLYAPDLGSLESALLAGEINLAPMPVSRGLRLPDHYVALFDAESTPTTGYGIACVGTGRNSVRAGGEEAWSPDHERMVDWLMEPALLDQLAASVRFGVVRAPSVADDRILFGQTQNDRSRWLAAMSGVQPDLEADRAFAARYDAELRGRGKTARWVGTAFDVLFAILFIAFIVFVKKHLDREEAPEAVSAPAVGSPSTELSNPKASKVDPSTESHQTGEPRS